MDTILLCSNHIPSVTSIHNTFIEKYMLGANGSYVKVYLYLSKCIQSGKEDLSISSLADMMENTEKDIIRALNYWEKQKLLKITRGEDKSVILGIDVLNPDEPLEAVSPKAPTATRNHPKLPHTDTSQKTDAAPADTHTNKTGATVLSKKISATTTDAALAGAMAATTEANAVLLSTDVATTESGTMATESDAATTEPGTVTTESGATTTESGATTTESGATTTESGATTTESGAATTESGAAVTDIGAAALEINTVISPEKKTANSKPAEMPAAPDVPLKKTSVKQHSFHVTPEQTKQLADNEEFCWTCNVVESYLERPVKPGEMQLLAYLYDNLHFSSELILHLYEYCISLGKTNTNYIQSVAIAWDEKQVRTPEDAQKASANYNASYNAVSRAFALGRSLAVIEKHYVERWQSDWKMDLGVILEACNRTMLKLQKADFKYTEGILDNWHKAGIHTLPEVEKADEAYARKKAAQKAPQQTRPAQAGNPSGKNRYSSYMQHGLSQEDANELEKRLLSI